MYYCAAKGLAAGYHTTPVLTDVTLGVERGEILTLIGPNGAGKSTLLKTLAGQLAAQAGTVLLDGCAMQKIPDRERAKKMALMLPGARRPELMTCFEVAAAGRYPYTGRLGVLSEQDRDVVQKALQTVGAAELAERDFTRISDGQRQRVLLARAICQQPEVLLLDEPTSFLDIKGKTDLLCILQRLARQNHLAILVSLHELDLAQKFSDRVACVAQGRVQCVGTPEDVFTAERIEALYGVENGSYDAANGSMELAAPQGEPQVFVIGGAGRGLPIYRRLQRQGVPFAAGILYGNDLELPAARALAAEVVAQDAFTPIDETVYRRALALMAHCATVLCAPQSEAPLNEYNRRLRDEAARQGKLKEYTPD